MDPLENWCSLEGAKFLAVLPLSNESINSMAKLLALPVLALAILAVRTGKTWALGPVICSTKKKRQILIEAQKQIAEDMYRTMSMFVVKSLNPKSMRLE